MVILSTASRQCPGDFAIAGNIARFCKNMDIATGSGRGSSVSSLVAYGLGVHKVDPIEHNLLFERFLHVNSKSQPDFDFDIAASKKILVENYLLAKYPNATKLSVISEKESGLDKQATTATIHPSGIGIVPQQLKDQLSYSSITDKYWQSQPLLNIDHKVAERLGVKKFDLLSSNVIESINRAEELISIGSSVARENVLDNSSIKSDQILRKNIDWKNINYHDPKTFELIKSGGTEGIYQLGSNYAKEICQQVKLEKFEDLVNLVALIRLSTKAYIEHFSENAKDNKPQGFSDPKGILKDTKGVILFQEQAMKLAEEYLGVPKEDTNSYRKDLEQGNHANPLISRDKFIAAAEGKGLSHKDASHLYNLMQEFSKFGYNKSHAVAYAQVTFKTAYLKAHHPEIFKESFKIKNEVTKDQERNIVMKKNSSVFTQVSTIKENNNNKIKNNITILTDSINTAASITQFNLDCNIIACAELENIKNYKAQPNEMLIIAYDGTKLNNQEKDLVQHNSFMLSIKSLIRTVEFENPNDLQEKIPPIVKRFASYSEREVKLISGFDNFKENRVEVDKFLEANPQIKEDFARFNPSFDLNQLTEKLEDLGEKARLKLISYELYNHFKPYAIEQASKLAEARENTKEFPELLKAINKEQEFCHEARQNYPEQLFLLSLDNGKETQNLSSMLYTYSKNPNIAQDIAKYYEDSQKLNSVNEVRLQHYIEDKLPVETLAKNLFARNQECIVGKAKMAVKYLESHGFTYYNSNRYENKLELLNCIASDKTYGIYAANYLKSEIEEHKKLEFHKQLEEKQKENQIANEPVTRAKSYDFELD